MYLLVEEWGRTWGLLQRKKVVWKALIHPATDPAVFNGDIASKR